jgi:hypothetical protein
MPQWFRMPHRFLMPRRLGMSHRLGRPHRLGMPERFPLRGGRRFRGLAVDARRLSIGLRGGGRFLAPFHRAGNGLRLGGRFDFFRLFFFYFRNRNRGGRGGVLALWRGCRKIRDVLTVVAAKLDRHVFIDRAGVRLLFGDAKPGEQVQYFMGLHFQLPRQLVNSDLSHR